jgi:hypothetical protein
MHSVVQSQLDMKMCQYGEHMVDIGNMKRGYSKLLYNQLNKDETIICHKKIIWRRTHYIKTSENTKGDYHSDVSYNTHRLTNLTIITWFLQSL